MICVPSSMQPSNIHRYEATQWNLHTQVALLNRSPSVSQTVFITVLHRLLMHISISHMPCVILGDFNENLIHQPNSRILNLMSAMALHK